DSGSRPIRTIAKRIGAEPPTTNTACQPNCRTTAAATHPAQAAPNEKPQNIVITAALRDRAGMYSEVSAMALGIAPPMPSPAMARNAVSCAIEAAVLVRSDPAPN